MGPEAKKGGKPPEGLRCTYCYSERLEATARAREYFGQVPPSSPSIAMFRDKELAHFVPRHAIEGAPADAVAFELVSAFDELAG